jgi:hypothetical protein
MKPVASPAHPSAAIRDVSVARSFFISASATLRSFAINALSSALSGAAAGA